jgi:hypothetical protein
MPVIAVPTTRTQEAFVARVSFEIFSRHRLWEVDTTLLRWTDPGANEDMEEGRMK